VPLTDRSKPEHRYDEDGPAQVRPIDARQLCARIQLTYWVYRLQSSSPSEEADEETDEETGRENRKRVHTLFPLGACQRIVDAPDLLPNLRTLAGVTTRPWSGQTGVSWTPRAGTRKTGFLYLPNAHLESLMRPVPDQPYREQLQEAVGLIDQMLQDFQFVTPHDRANYIGMLLTPLLRELLPLPYKLGLIEAYQPGSGKGLLAEILGELHGRVCRLGQPDTEEEWTKSVTAILDADTAPVVVFDNVREKLQSAVLTGLMTSDRFDTRRLGRDDTLLRLHNDRLWVVTANNLALGNEDWPRRVLRSRIDPGQPHPELRTDFAIPDLLGWVRQHRADLLWSLLVMIRAWVVAGRPTEPRSSDSYRDWVAGIDGILRHAGVEGEFDHLGLRGDVEGAESKWAEFLQASYQVLGSKPVTTRE
jgi:hypothetical protein